MVTFKSKIPKKLSFDFVYTSGKHEGKTVRGVLEIDHKAIIWDALFNKNGYKQEVLDAAFEREDVPQ